MGLGEQITECVVASGLNDQHQRSAIGMAGIWVRRREPVKVAANPLDLYLGRDKLACDLVVIMEANPATDEEYVAALQAARAVIDAPFQTDWREGRAALTKPKEQKKAREASRSN